MPSRRPPPRSCSSPLRSRTTRSGAAAAGSARRCSSWPRSGRWRCRSPRADVRWRRRRRLRRLPAHARGRPGAVPGPACLHAAPRWRLARVHPAEGCGRAAAGVRPPARQRRGDGPGDDASDPAGFRLGRRRDRDVSGEERRAGRQGILRARRYARRRPAARSLLLARAGPPWIHPQPTRTSRRCGGRGRSGRSSRAPGSPSASCAGRSRIRPNR